MKRRIAILTTGRQDFGILRSTCAALSADARFDLTLWSGGTHECAGYGSTAQEILDDGFRLDERLVWVDDVHTPASQQASRALEQVTGALERQNPDAVILAGDRFETAAAALAATLARTPIVHLHGGEETEGAVDNALRHAITKLSHLHLVSHELHAKRVRQMGEDPASVFVVGAPSLDLLQRADLPDRAALAKHLGIPLEGPLLLVTLHPATLAGEDGRATANALLRALARTDATCVITLPNADAGSAAIRAVMCTQKGLPRRVVVEALGALRYAGLLRLVDAVVGNSSSGIIEAPAARVPAVNIGERQRGRLRGDNVIDCGVNEEEIVGAIREALSPTMKERVRASPAPYGDGHSASRIVTILAGWTPPSPPVKRFREPEGAEFRAGTP